MASSYGRIYNTVKNTVNSVSKSLQPSQPKPPTVPSVPTPSYTYKPAGALGSIIGSIGSTIGNAIRSGSSSSGGSGGSGGSSSGSSGGSNGSSFPSVPGGNLGTIGLGAGLSMIPGLGGLGSTLVNIGTSREASNQTSGSNTMNQAPTTNVNPVQAGMGLQLGGLGMNMLSGLGASSLALPGMALQKVGQQLSGGQSVVPSLMPNTSDIKAAPTVEQKIAPPGSLAEVDQLAQYFASNGLAEAANGRAEVQAGSLQMMNQTLDQITTLEQQLMSRMKDMLGGVDEATMWALNGVKKTVQEQRDRLMDEMNRRGLLQSGIWLGEENQINANQLDAESQIRLSRVGDLQNMLMNGLTNFANQRIQAMQQYGRDYVNSIDQEYKNRMAAWENATGNAINWVGKQQQLAQDQNQFNADLGYKYAGLNNDIRHNMEMENQSELARQFNQRQGLSEMWGVDPVTGRPTLNSKLVNSQITENQAQAARSQQLAAKGTGGSGGSTTKAEKEQKANTIANKVETYYKNWLPNNFADRNLGPDEYAKYLKYPDRAAKIINDIGASEYRKLVAWADAQVKAAIAASKGY